MNQQTGPQREDGRHLFGRDAASYARHRPAYPEALWPLLDAYRPPVGRHFEIGPGTGQASARLLAAGSQLTAIEPDPGLAGPLRRQLAPALASGQLQVLESSFEAAATPCPPFDAGHAATSFHWLQPAAALAQVRRWLRPGGAWAMWWNVFGDPRQPDALARATGDLFAGLPGAGSQRQGLPFALDSRARCAELAAAGFTAIEQHTLHWELRQDTAQVVGLAATFSQVASLDAPRRQRFLDSLAERVEQRFHGCVQRHFLTPLYLATAP